MNANKLLLLSDIESSGSLPEQVVRALMETSDVGIAVIQGMCIKFTNQQFLDRIKYDRKELEAKYVSELIHPDDVDFLVKRYAGVSNGSIDPNTPLEFRCLAKDGTVIHVDAKVTLIQWEGALAGLCLFWDVEKRKVVEEYLRREVKTRSDIINGISERLVHTDSELRIIFANRAASESAGISPDEIVGRFCYDVFRRGDEPCEECPARETIATGRAAEGRVVYPDGRTLMVQSYPVMGGDNTPTGSVIKYVDVTDRAGEARSPDGERPSRESSGPDSPAVLSAPADPNYLYPFSLAVDYRDGRIVSTLAWSRRERTMVLAKLGKSELHSARFLYLAARMKSDGEGWVDKEVIRPGKMDYNLYDLRKFLEQCRVPWLDGKSARMLIRSGGEANRMIRLAIAADGITISSRVGEYRPQKYKRLAETEKRIASLQKELSRWPDDEYASHELQVQQKNLEDTRKSIETVEFLIAEALRLLSHTQKIFIEFFSPLIKPLS